jgi:hypothetical protein
MKTLATAAALAALAASGAQAQPPANASKLVYRAATTAAQDTIAPLARPDTKRVQVQVKRCRNLPGRWNGCRVHVKGATFCNVVLRVRVTDRMYAAWVPRMRCR